VSLSIANLPWKTASQSTEKDLSPKSRLRKSVLTPLVVLSHSVVEKEAKKAAKAAKFEAKESKKVLHRVSVLTVESGGLCSCN